MYAYYTVENARRSTGLGLYIAKTLTKRMGGDIRAVYDNITYDEDAKQICKTYIDNGEYTPNITY